jgi:alpha/beta hydrolase fold
MNMIKPGTNTSFGSLKQIDAGVLNVGYAEAGPTDGPAVILLHGWPYDIHSYVDVAPLLASAGYRVIVPYLRGYGATRFLSSETFRNGQQSVIALDIIALMDALKISKAPLPPKAELQWWYQYYFATERGRAGYDKYRHDFAKLIWQLASPKWDFDDATFDPSAASFDNPDHVSIVIHNYRWRLGLAEGEPIRSPKGGLPRQTTPLKFTKTKENCYGKPHQRNHADRSPPLPLQRAGSGTYRIAQAHKRDQVA